MNNLLNHIPGDLSWPLVGDTIGFLTRPLALFNEKQARYGNIFKMRLFGHQSVFMTGAEANRFLLIEQARHCSSKEGWRVPIGELFHGGLMLRDGDDHKHHRGLLQAAFKKDPMRQYLDVMEPIVTGRLSDWTNQPTLRVFPAVKALTLELAGKVFFDLEFSDKLSQLNRALADLVAAATTALPVNWPFTQYRRGMKGRALLQAYFKPVIRERRQNPAADMLSQLCLAEDEEGNHLTDQEIIDHLIFFLMAAHDTTASTLTSLMYELARHPDWQAQLRTECGTLPTTEPLTIGTLNQLDTLGYVIDETLRLHPPLILIPRQITQDLTFQGTTFPAGTKLNVLLYHNHQNPAYWTNPDQFDPLRFAEGRTEHRKCPHAYAPFGAGQHHCLGFAFADMQVRLVMYHILTRFRWQLPANYTPRFANIPIQHPTDGLRIELMALEPVYR